VLPEFHLLKTQEQTAGHVAMKVGNIDASRECEFKHDYIGFDAGAYYLFCKILAPMNVKKSEEVPCNENNVK
jgi:hypothetical protein